MPHRDVRAAGSACKPSSAADLVGSDGNLVGAKLPVVAGHHDAVRDAGLHVHLQGTTDPMPVNLLRVTAPQIGTSLGTCQVSQHCVYMLITHGTTHVGAISAPGSQYADVRQAACHRLEGHAPCRWGKAMVDLLIRSITTT